MPLHINGTLGCAPSFLHLSGYINAEVKQKSCNLYRFANLLDIKMC